MLSWFGPYDFEEIANLAQRPKFYDLILTF